MERKKEILRDHFTKSTPIPVLARLNDINPITLYSWKRAMKNKDPNQINLKELLAENENLKAENKKLLRAVGKAQLRNETAEEIIEDYKKKISHQQLQEQESLSKVANRKRVKK